jgi:hypothetical protein
LRSQENDTKIQVWDLQSKPIIIISLSEANQIQSSTPTTKTDVYREELFVNYTTLHKTPALQIAAPKFETKSQRNCAKYQISPPFGRAPYIQPAP